MSEQLSAEERKEWARGLYTKENYSISDTARIVRVEETTIAQWKDEEGWEGIRCSLATSKNKQLKLMYETIAKLQERIGADVNTINSKDVDMMVKYTRAIKNLETKVAVSVMIEVFEDFVLWLRKKDSGLARVVAPRFSNYIQMHVKKLS